VQLDAVPRALLFLHEVLDPVALLADELVDGGSAVALVGG